MPISCTICGARVTDQAPACPQCGAPWSPALRNHAARGSQAAYTAIAAGFVAIISAATLMISRLPHREFGDPPRSVLPWRETQPEDPYVPHPQMQAVLHDAFLRAGAWRAAHPGQEMLGVDLYDGRPGPGVSDYTVILSGEGERGFCVGLLYQGAGPLQTPYSVDQDARLYVGPGCLSRPHRTFDWALPASP